MGSIIESVSQGFDPIIVFMNISTPPSVGEIGPSVPRIVSQLRTYEPQLIRGRRPVEGFRPYRPRFTAGERMLPPIPSIRMISLDERGEGSICANTNIRPNSQRTAI